MNFTLTVLGTASALPTTYRNPSAQVLDVRGRLFLIDCGEGTQMKLRAAGVSFLKIEHICLSHLHGDHLFGLFGLLSTMAMLGRTSDLNIYAPKTFDSVLKFFLSHFGEGMKYRINFLPLDMKQPEIIHENKHTELLAFPLNHRIETFGFIVREKMPPLNINKEAISRYGLSLSEIATLKRGENVVRPAGPLQEPSAENGFQRFSGTDEPQIITTEDAAYIPFKPRSYAYCSDTAPFPQLKEWVRGVDLLYHEATFPEEMTEMAGKTFHSTTIQAATTAREAGVSRLIVGHYSSRYPSISFFRDEMLPVFSEVTLARDGDIFEIPLVK